MTRKQRRGVTIALAVGVLGVALGLVLYAMRGSIVYFHTPHEVAERKIQPGQRFRLGGLVAKGSLKRTGAVAEFVVTDTKKDIRVSYRGTLPDLFREEQGVVAEGVLAADGTFTADSVLAKHDETYMPPEVAKALKEQGVWQQGPSPKPKTNPGGKS